MASNVTERLPVSFKRYLNVVIDGLLQAAAVAMVASLMTGLLLAFGHIHGPWIDRLFGVIAGVIFVPLAVIALKMMRTKKRSTLRALEFPKGFLDYKFQVETALTALPPVISKLTIIMGDVTKSMSKHTGDMRRVRSGSSQKQLKVTQDVAGSLDRNSSRMESVLSRLSNLEASLSEGFNGWSIWVEKQTHADISELSAFAAQLKDLVV